MPWPGGEVLWGQAPMKVVGAHTELGSAVKTRVETNGR